MAECEALPERINEEILACKICFLRYEAANPPKMLACSHTFCQQCIVDYLRSKKAKNKTRFPCPLCRQPTAVTGGEAGVKALANNYTVCDLMDLMLGEATADRGGPQPTTVTPQRAAPPPPTATTTTTTRLADETNNTQGGVIQATSPPPPVATTPQQARVAVTLAPREEQCCRCGQNKGVHAIKCQHKICKTCKKKDKKMDVAGVLPCQICLGPTDPTATSPELATATPPPPDDDLPPPYSEHEDGERPPAYNPDAYETTDPQSQYSGHQAPSYVGQYPLVHGYQQAGYIPASGVQVMAATGYAGIQAVPLSGYAPNATVQAVPMSGYTPSGSVQAVPMSGYTPGGSVQAVPVSGYTTTPGGSVQAVPMSGYTPGGSVQAVPVSGYTPVTNGLTDDLVSRLQINENHQAADAEQLYSGQTALSPGSNQHGYMPAQGPPASYTQQAHHPQEQPAAHDHSNQVPTHSSQQPAYSQASQGQGQGQIPQSHTTESQGQSDQVQGYSQGQSHGGRDAVSDKSDQTVSALPQLPVHNVSNIPLHVVGHNKQPQVSAGTDSSPTNPTAENFTATADSQFSRSVVTGVPVLPGTVGILRQALKSRIPNGTPPPQASDNPISPEPKPAEQEVAPAIKKRPAPAVHGPKAANSPRNSVGRNSPVSVHKESPTPDGQGQVPLSTAPTGPKVPPRRLLGEPQGLPFKCVNKFGRYSDTKMQSGAFEQATRVSVSEDGRNIVVTDAQGMTVQVFTSDGQYTNMFKVLGVQGACLWAQDKLAVATHRGVEVYSISGYQEKEIPVGPVVNTVPYKHGFIAVRQKSLLFYGANLTQTRELTKKKHKSSPFKKSVPFEGIRDVAVSMTKELVVLEGAGGEMTIMDDEGTIRSVIVPQNESCGRLQEPYAVTFDRWANIFVSDLQSRKVLRFSPNGRFSRCVLNFTLGETSTPTSDIKAYGISASAAADHLIIVIGGATCAEVRVYKLF